MARFNKLFDSAKQEWTTPDNVYQPLLDEFAFEWDLAADAENTKCSKFYDEQANSLVRDWRGICWLNPPYGDKRHKLVDWIKKAFYEGQRDGCIVVMLIPARTNTIWWHEYCMKAAEVRLICGRPKFGGATHGLPWPLAIVVFKKHEGDVKFSTFRIGATAMHRDYSSPKDG